jgi:hypothetical protein
MEEDLGIPSASGPWSTCGNHDPECQHNLTNIVMRSADLKRFTFTHKDGSKDAPARTHLIQLARVFRNELLNSSTFVC